MKQFLKEVVSGRKRLFLVGAAFLAVVVVNMLYFNRAFGYFVLDDELGYWSNAAHLAGFDWSGVTGRMNWYSYGYSLILYVLIRIARLFYGNMTAAYRLAVCANALMCGGVFLLGYGAIRRLTEKDEWMALVGGAASALTVMLVSHSRVGWTECTLALLTTAVAAIAVYDPQRKRLALNALLSLLVGYTYLVHNRMAGLLLAFAVYAVAVIIAGDRRLQKALALLLPLAAVIVIDGYASRFFKVKMWGVAESASNPHTVSMMVGKLKALFSVQGALAFVREAIGQLWYLGTSTFGLFYLGLIQVFASLKQSVEKRHVGETLAWGLVLFGFVFCLGVSVVYWFSVYMPDGARGRADVYYYGRYIENWASIYVALGCCRLRRAFDRKPGWIGVGLFAALHLLATVSIETVPDMAAKTVNRICVVGTAVVSELFTNRITVRGATIPFLAVAGLFAAAILIGRRRGKLRRLVYVPLIVAILISVAASGKHAKAFIGSYHRSIDKLYQIEQSELKLPDNEPRVLVGFPDSFSPIDNVCVAMKRLQFLKPRSRCGFAKADALEDYLDGRADCLMLNTAAGVEYSAGALAPYRGVYLSESNAILFDLNDRGQDPGIDIPMLSVFVENGTVERGRALSGEEGALAVFTPYLPLPAGRYTATVEGRLVSGALSGACSLEVTGEKDQKRLAAVDDPGDGLDGDAFRWTCPFALEQDEETCRIRLRTDSGARVAVTRVTLRRLDDGI